MKERQREEELLEVWKRAVGIVKQLTMGVTIR